MTRRRHTILGVAQIRQHGEVARNLREITRAIEQARTAKVSILCFPECALTGYGAVCYESSADFDAGVVTSALKEVRAMARAAGMTLIIGAHLPMEYPRSEAGGWTNSVLAIGPSGRTSNRYDKAHLYGRDVEYYRAGHKRAVVKTCGGVRIGMQICFDIRFLAAFDLLARGGVEIIFVPSYIHGKDGMWKGALIDGHVRVRAADTGRFVVFANAAGKTQNVPSLIAGPRGDPVVRARRGARQIITARIDLAEVNDEVISGARTDLYPVDRI